MQNRYLTLCATLFVTFSLISVATGYKLVSLHGLIISGAAIALPFRYLLGDIITEVYGYSTGKQQVFNLFIACLVFSVFCVLIVHLPSPNFWPYEPYYRYVLGNSLKITVVALAGVVMGAFVNIFLLQSLKISFKMRSFSQRAFLSSCAGDLLQYIIVLTILYLPQLSFYNLIKLIFSDYLIQVLIIALLTFPAKMIMVGLAKAENKKEVINPNPFAH